ncbi:MAG: hypothetical protein J0I06_11575 [Planctomycetes bacterium]|nr:hypothetical protein [Planctomycetota bacterium]
MLVLHGEGPVQSLAFAPDGATLYAAQGRHHDVRAWNLADRTAVPFVAGGETMVGALHFLPGGRWAVGHSNRSAPPRDNPFRLIDVPAGTARPFPFCTWYGHAAAADGSQLVGLGHSHYDEERAAESSCYRLYGWTLTPAGLEYAWHRNLSTHTDVRSVTRLGADRFATAATVRFSANLLDSAAWRIEVTVRRAADGEPEEEHAAPQQRVQQLLASPQGDKLVLRSGTGLRVWDANDLKKRPAIVEGKFKSTMEPPAAAFDPSGRYLLLANDGPSVIVYDTTTWKQVRKWKWDVGVLRAVAVAPDGTLAAAAGPRGAIAVWDLDL